MTEPAFQAPNLDVPEQIADLLSPAIALTIYFRPEPAKYRDGMIACWEEFLTGWGGGLSWCAEEGGKFLPPTPKRLSRPAERLRSCKTMPFYAWRAFSGATSQSAGALSWDCIVRDPSASSPAMRSKEEKKHCFLRVSFAPSAFQTRAKLDELVAIARRWAGRLPFVHGYGGLSLNITGPARPGQAWGGYCLPLIRRYPGFDVEDCGGTALCVPDQIRGVNWLTILCGEFVARLGGASALRGQLPEPVILHELPGGGAIVQAGPAPTAGDAGRGDMAPLYGAVTKALLPIRITEERYTCLPPEWLHRFESPSPIDSRRSPGWTG